VCILMECVRSVPGASRAGSKTGTIGVPLGNSNWRGEEIMNASVLKKCWRKALWLGLVALAIVPLGRAQAPALAAQSRITAAVNENNRVTLRGNTHPLARPQFDQGAVADAQPIQRVLLLLQRSPEQETALRALLDQQQSKSSSSYHQWLTPQQFGQQFGPSDADVAAVTGWLESHGFQVNRVSAGKTVIEFSGNAGQVRDAFGTELHRFVVNGQQHLANASDPQIPAALAPVVAGAVSLNDFGRKALHKVGGFIASSPQATGVKPAFTGTCNSGPGTPSFTCYVVAPFDFATIYNSLALWNSATPVDGTGQTIAIVGDSNINCSDVTNFRTFFDLPVSNPNDCTKATSNVQVILDGPDPGLTPDEIEADLDVEWSGAVAKGAHIDFVTSESTDVSAGVDLSAEYIIDNNLAPVMSESFGDCELNLGNGGSEFYSALWEQAAAQGITVMISAGDSGAADCDNDNQVDVSSDGLAVSGLASTPFNVAVGGTDFNDAGNQATFWNPGSNGTTQQSVKGYVPEIPWDDSCAASSATGCSGVTISGAPASLNIVAGGGGQSNCVTQNIAGVCTGGFLKPAWQSGKAVTGLAMTDGTRDVPDVSLFAAAGSGSNSFYPICESDAGALCSDGSFIGVGGTSSSAPAFAGIMAMINQYMVTQSMPTRQGNANYVLYSLAASQVTAGTSCNSTSSPNTASTTGCTFYDITMGSNSVPCVFGTGCTIQNLNANIPGVLEKPSGTLAWQAGTGFDLSTGLGSVNAFNLVHNWPAAVGLFTPTSTTLQLCTGGSPTAGCSTSISIVHGAKVFVDAVVSPSPGTATGTKAEDIALIGTPNTTSNNGGSATSAPDRFSASAGGNEDIYPLNGGSTSGDFTNFLVGGTYAITAHYTGDGTFGASDSPAVNVNISPEGSKTTITFEGAIDPMNPNGNLLNSTAYGLPDFFRVDVLGVTSGEETATGNVTVTDNGSPVGGAGCCALNSEGRLDFEPGINLIQTLSTAAHSFLASYAGDASYTSSASSPALSFTVTPAPTPIAAMSSPTTVASGGTVTLTANVSPDSIGVAPSGTVTFFANGVAIAVGAANYVRTNGSLLGAPGTGTGTVFAGLVATLSYKPAASTTITAMYVAGADPNYASSALSAPVALTVTNTPGFSFSSANNSDANAVAIAAPGGTGTSTVTVTSLNGFAGTVTMTCSVAPAGVTDEPTCSFPGGNSVNLAANGTQTPTVMLSTTATSSLPKPPVQRPGPMGLPFGVLSLFAWIVAAMLAVLASSLVKPLPERRRGYAWFAVLLLLVTIAAVACSSSRSAGGGTGNNNTGTPTGFYTVTVSGTSGATTGTAGMAVFNLQ